MLDFDRGYIAGYKKAYEEIMIMATKNIQKTTIDNPIKGAEGIQGPIGYMPHYNSNMGAVGPMGPM